jgi:hypothetical protein
MEFLQRTIEVNVEVSFVVHINSLQNEFQSLRETPRDEIGGTRTWS